MKNKAICLITSLLLLINTSQASVSTNQSKIENTSDLESQKLVRRLEEIKKMDIKKMSRSEKNNLTVEVESIAKKLQYRGPVIVISAGALILIIILLIILL